MKYIIMCGGDYPQFETPKQLTWLGTECIVQRTIRLLREAGVEDIAISTNKRATFEKFGVPIIDQTEYDRGIWLYGAFPKIDGPCTYLFGDVVFSREAIKTIVNKVTDDVDFFASGAPFAKEYTKVWAEPFAFKVVNQAKFRKSIDETIRLYQANMLSRCIAWELWQVIKGTQLNNIIVNYTVVNDFTCDCDSAHDLTDIKDRLLYYGMKLEDV